MRKGTLESSGIGFFGSLRIRALRDGVVLRETGPIPNKVVSGSGGYGRNLVARALKGDTTYPLEIDSAALGDDDTAPADSDTDLGNALVTGVGITNIEVSNNSLQIDVFIADGNLPDGTYKEFGLYCNGRLFARILISPSYTKVPGEDTLFTYTLPLTG